MKQYRKTLIAGMVATLFAAPVWAGSASDQTASEHPLLLAEGTTHSPSASATVGSDLRAMTPRDLNGVDVVDASGQKIGEVKTIVHSRSADEPYAVISSGGFMGVGDKEIVISLDELQWSGDRLQTASSRSALESSPEYMTEQYVEVQPADEPISEFSAFEAAPEERSLENNSTWQADQLPPEDPRKSSEDAPRREDLPPSHQQ